MTATKYLLLGISLVGLIGCKIGVSSASIGTGNQPPTPTPTTPAAPTFNSGVADLQIIRTGVSIAVTGHCMAGQSVLVVGTALAAPQATLCDAAGNFQLILLFSGVAGTGLTLTALHTIEGVIYSTQLTLELATPCGDPQILACAVDGLGTLTAPYGISSIDCLQKMELGKQCHYKLVANIDASATTTWNSGAGWIPVGQYGSPMTGNLNGQGFKISNLFINYTGQFFYETGLFGCTNGSTIENLELENVNVYGESLGARGIGALVGWADNSVINKLRVSGQVGGGDNVGGVVGRYSYLELFLADFNGTVYSNSTTDRIGGLVGGMGNMLTLHNSTFRGAINITEGSSPKVGGIVSELNGVAENTISRGIITLSPGVTGSVRVGGIAGVMDSGAVVENSYFAGSIVDLASSAQPGGIASQISDNGVISQSFVASSAIPSPGGVLAFSVSSTGTLLNQSRWYQHGGVPAAHVHSGSFAVEMASNSENAIAYFYNPSNVPMIAWDFTNTWIEVPGDFPNLLPY